GFGRLDQTQDLAFGLDEFVQSSFGRKPGKGTRSVQCKGQPDDARRPVLQEFLDEFNRPPPQVRNSLTLVSERSVDRGRLECGELKKLDTNRQLARCRRVGGRQTEESLRVLGKEGQRDVIGFREALQIEFLQERFPQLPQGADLTFKLRFVSRD